MAFANLGSFLRHLESHRDLHRVTVPVDPVYEMGEIAQRVLRASLGQEMLCSRFCDALEEKLHLRAAPIE